MLIYITIKMFTISNTHVEYIFINYAKYFFLQYKKKLYFISTRTKTHYIIIIFLQMSRAREAARNITNRRVTARYIIAESYLRFMLEQFFNYILISQRTRLIKRDLYICIKTYDIRVEWLTRKCLIIPQTNHLVNYILRAKQKSRIAI